MYLEKSRDSVLKIVIDVYTNLVSIVLEIKGGYCYMEATWARFILVNNSVFKYYI